MNIKEEINRNNQIRDEILKKLYMHAEKNPQGYLEKESIQNKTGIDTNKLNQEVLFLKEKNYLEITTHSTVYFEAARITHSGRIYVENLKNL